jgi:hypothetical protein
MSDKATYKGLGAFIGGVETLSSASTIVTLTLDQQSKLLLWPGNAGPSRILLPQAQIGLVYRVAIIDDAVSSATKFVSSGGSDDLYFSIETQIQTTGQAVAYGSTLEGGQVVTMEAISDNRWLVTGTRTTVSDGGLGSTTT